MAKRKRTQRQATGPTGRTGMPQRRDQHRPTPSGHPATPGGARPQHTPPKHESDAVRTTLAHAHQPPEATQGEEGTPTRGEGPTPTEEIPENTAAQPTTTPSPPGDDPGHSKGHLTGTGRGRGRGHSTRARGKDPQMTRDRSTGPEGGLPRGHLPDPPARAAHPDHDSTDPASQPTPNRTPQPQGCHTPTRTPHHDKGGTDLHRPTTAQKDAAQHTAPQRTRSPEANSPGLPDSPSPCRGLHTYAQRAHNTHSPARLSVPVGRHPAPLPFGNSAFGTPHRSAPPCNAPRQGTPRHNTPQHDATQRGTARHSATQHGATWRDPAGRNATQHGPARHRTAKNGRTQHGAPQHSRTREQGTLTEGPTETIRRTPWKAPHQPATHLQGATARPATTVAVRSDKLPPES